MKKINTKQQAAANPDKYDLLHKSKAVTHVVNNQPLINYLDIVEISSSGNKSDLGDDFKSPDKIEINQRPMLEEVRSLNLKPLKIAKNFAKPRSIAQYPNIYPKEQEISDDISKNGKINYDDTNNEVNQTDNGGKKSVFALIEDHNMKNSQKSNYNLINNPSQSVNNGMSCQASVNLSKNFNYENYSNIYQYKNNDMFFPQNPMFFPQNPMFNTKNVDNSFINDNFSNKSLNSGYYFPQNAYTNNFANMAYNNPNNFKKDNSVNFNAINNNICNNFNLNNGYNLQYNKKCINYFMQNQDPSSMMNRMNYHNDKMAPYSYFNNNGNYCNTNNNFEMMNGGAGVCSCCFNKQAQGNMMQNTF